ncbi:hypothetical protein L596_008772 [Steinernema carpocapsae]|uniref:G-protein coupled receptors family 1 profile domain-containing protein n=1 Tax=Steinernema carpocapsae TaxID=34508 RepID=A0A4U5PDR8_STECR|nr:hypothetical protein L596_008772 [Steinernema carpocapsae]
MKLSLVSGILLVIINGISIICHFCKTKKIRHFGTFFALLLTYTLCGLLNFVTALNSISNFYELNPEQYAGFVVWITFESFYAWMYNQLLSLVSCLLAIDRLIALWLPLRYYSLNISVKFSVLVGFLTCLTFAMCVLMTLAQHSETYFSALVIWLYINENYVIPLTMLLETIVYVTVFILLVKMQKTQSRNLTSSNQHQNAIVVHTLLILIPQVNHVLPELFKCCLSMVKSFDYEFKSDYFCPYTEPYCKLGAGLLTILMNFMCIWFHFRAFKEPLTLGAG